MSDCPSQETLVALWAGELGEEETAAVDEHVFGCDDCAAEIDGLANVIGALRENLPFVISHAHRERLVAAGQRVNVTTVDPTPTRKAEKTARFTPEVDLLVFALRADVSTADRVDVKIASQSGDKEYLLEDVPFDRGSGEVLICCQRHFEDMFPGADPVFSVHAIQAGKRREVGDYVVAHVWR